MHNHYEYKVEQSHFEKENKESLTIVCSVVATCEASKICIIPKPIILSFLHQLGLTDLAELSSIL